MCLPGCLLAVPLVLFAVFTSTLVPAVADSQVLACMQPMAVLLQVVNQLLTIEQCRTVPHIQAESHCFLFAAMQWSPPPTFWDPSPPAVSDKPAVGVLQRMAFDLLLGIISLHKQGIAHRDIKPGNIGCTHGRLVLLDLGAARVGRGLWKSNTHEHSHAVGGSFC